MNPHAFALMMLNADLSDASLIPYLDALVAAGYTGICPHPREGMQVPYLSNEFWERLERIVELAQERGLKIWLYDEFPYPSGAAGGIVTGRYPETRIRGLAFQEVVPASGEKLTFLSEAPVLAVLRLQRDGRGQISVSGDVTSDCGPYQDTWGWNEWHNRFYTGALHVREEKHERGFAMRGGWAYKAREPLGLDEFLLVISLQNVAGKPGWHGMPDVTRAEVTDIFLDLTYRPYADMARRHGLRSVPIFQDEVTFFTSTPWNSEIERRWRQEWGENWAVQLAALQYPQLPGWEYARWRYRAICQDCFEKNWFERCGAFCRENGLVMTGHLAGEESIMGHTALLGNIFRNLRHFDIPGYDLISSPTADDENRCQALGAKLVQSTAWLENKNTVMVEVFGAHGHHLDWRTARTELAWLAVHGMTEFLDHSSYMSGLGTRKYEAPPVNNRFNPLFEATADLWQWHAWFMEQMEEFQFHPTTLVFFPVESLARFQFSEMEHWRPQVALLESFFHFLCAHSLDCVFLSTDYLDQVNPVPEGFELNGHTFSHFVVPPAPSFLADAADKLRRLAPSAGFVHFQPNSSGVEVFGAENGPSHGVPLATLNSLGAWRVEQCDEKTLDAEGASYFAGILPAPLRSFRGQASVLKSLRKNAAGEQILVLVNPQQETIQVDLGEIDVTPLRQPPHGYTAHPAVDTHISTVDLPGRDVMVLRAADGRKTDELSGAGHPIGRSCRDGVITPERAIVSSNAPNAYSLKLGTVCVEGQTVREFQPGAVSRLWRLNDVPYEPNEVLQPHFSQAPLPHSRAFQAQFPVQVREDLIALTVVLDSESIPPGAQVLWDGVPLTARLASVYSQDNTIYRISPEMLGAGEHRLSVEGKVTHAWQGLLERPIVCGPFAVQEESPLVLGHTPSAMVWAGDTGWNALGVPEGSGPVLYTCHFVIPQSPPPGEVCWEAVLPGLRGHATVKVNGTKAGRICWGSLPLPAGLLQSGTNRIEVELTATWNNLFSTLNRRENGLTGVPVLRWREPYPEATGAG